MNRNSNDGAILRAININKSYDQGSGKSLIKIDVLRHINLCINTAQSISITGSSGSGKSTLLHILAGLIKPTSGSLLLNDKVELSSLHDGQLCNIRNQSFGFIYQFHHLLPEFTALENVLMPTLIGVTSSFAQISHKAIISEQIAANRKMATEILDRLGLAKRVNHYPSELSGGERQRVAIARALINKPKIIFADEPTGNLDNTTAQAVLQVFFALQQEFSTSVVIVTHDNNVSKMTNQSYMLHQGELSDV